MKAILADINVQGHLHVLLSLLEGDEWRELWHSFNLTVLFFRDAAQRIVGRGRMDKDRRKILDPPHPGICVQLSTMDVQPA